MNTTIEDIFEKPDYSKLFGKEYVDNIIARPKSEDSQMGKENLPHHSKTTLDFFDKLTLELNLKPIFKNLIERAFGKYNEKYWYLLRAIIYFHDFGKMNDAFQQKMKEIEENKQTKKTPASDHALPGLFLFGLLLEVYLKNEIPQTKTLAFYLSSVIARHHTNLHSPIEIGDKIDELWGEKTDNKDNTKFQEFKSLLDKIRKKTRDTNQIHNLRLWFNPHINLPQNRPGAFFRYVQDNLPDNAEKCEAIFYLHKLLYSCLVSSDYYAAYYREAHEKITNTLPDIKHLKENLKREILKKKSEKFVSIARENFRKIAYQRLSENMDKNVFYLYLPTGGGKTLTSLDLALELVEKNNLKRIFYVFPFVNIIEQNQKVLKDALGDEQLVSPIYSYSEWDLKEGEDDKIHFINQEFTNYPVVILSNVNFFNALIKNGKNSNYKLHNFANSVIIIDEIQSLNAREWTLYNNLIINSAKMLNSKIIIMSASIPPIYKLSEDDGVKEEISVLIGSDDDELKKEFRKFWERVDLKLGKDQDLLTLAKEKIEENNYPEKVLIVSNTIKKSFETFDKLQKETNLKEKYPKILLLNSTMLPSRRKEIIELIGKEGERLILVSTQSVEAGLDVDFDIGIRELAPLDNLLQVCGRVNRNMKEGKYQVYVATKNTDKDSKVYGDLRFGGKKNGEENKESENDSKKNGNMQEKIKELLKTEDPLDIKYNKYSQDLIAAIQKQNKKIYQESQRHSVESLRDLDFDSLNKHNIIETESVSIFVPIDIPLSESGENGSKENSGLLQLARDLDKNSPIKILKDNTLLSEGVLELYISTCKFKNKDKKIELKKLAPLLNQFIFSVSLYHSRLLNRYTIDVFSEYKNKKNSSLFLKLNKALIKEIYTHENGLNLKELKDNEEAVVF